MAVSATNVRRLHHPPRPGLVGPVHGLWPRHRASRRTKHGGVPIRHGNHNSTGQSVIPFGLFGSQTRMGLTDVVVLAVYLLGVVALGVRYSGRQTNVQDYFLTSKRIPWWALLGSIAATETQHRHAHQRSGVCIRWGSNLPPAGTWVRAGQGVGRPCPHTRVLPRGAVDGLSASGPTIRPECRQVDGDDLSRNPLAVGTAFVCFATGLVLAVVLASVPGLSGLVGAWAADH